MFRIFGLLIFIIFLAVPGAQASFLTSAEKIELRAKEARSRIQTASKEEQFKLEEAATRLDKLALTMRGLEAVAPWQPPNRINEILARMDAFASKQYFKEGLSACDRKTIAAKMVRDFNGPMVEPEQAKDEFDTQDTVMFAKLGFSFSTDRSAVPAFKTHLAIWQYRVEENKDCKQVPSQGE